ncbi:MAG: ATP-dependent Clp protease ATP-binding subunit [Acutalibacteraceae bacterium]
MLCCRCKKRPAVVFVATNAESDSKGYCLTCAKELGIKPVTDIMEKMGISEDDLDAVQEQMDSLMAMSENGEIPGFAEMMGADMQPSDDEDGDEDGAFSPGGAPTFPLFKNLFTQNNPEASDAKNQSGKQNKKNRKNDKVPKRKHIDAYCYDLTKKARSGKMDVVIGRDKEIARVIQILSRRSKNNPCLIGEPGVGKTAIAEGLALRIAQGNVPQRLKNKEVHLLDLTALIAGTQFRGQFESRIKGLTEEVKAAGNIILFIDEVHNLVGTGDSEGTMNAANILKPSLSRGEIQVIGATTFNEYRKYIEKDAALERRFQPVTITEPSIKDAIEVLNGVKGYYEAHHRVKVDEMIIRRAVVLSERYITDRFLPDKAIDLLDEACACAALRNKSMEKYDKLIEEKNALQLKSDEISVDPENIDYEALAKVKEELSKVENSIKRIEKKALNSHVEESDIAHVIELWTGIPASRVQENELNKLADLEEKLKKSIIGQDEAVAAVSAAIRRSRVQISPRRRPASFIFVGPTGVGKTELVKVLSEELFDTPETLIRLDMSEFMEKHSVSKIIGAPPGYVGYDEAGQVTEKVRRRPYSVLLFDEIEKAHPDVMNILLQILDEGKLTDAHGRNVNFENTVIIMTSNAGSNKKEGLIGFGKTEGELKKEKAKKALSEFLRPEFLARIDEIIVFNSLTDDNLVDIARLMLGEYVATLDEKGIKFTFDDKAANFLAQQAKGGASGARDLRNIIRKKAEDAIASAMISAREGEITAINLTASDDDIVLQIL